MKASKKRDGLLVGKEKITKSQAGGDLHRGMVTFKYGKLLINEG